MKYAYLGLHVSSLLSLSELFETRAGWRISVKKKKGNFADIRPAGGELFHANRRAGMRRLIHISLSQVFLTYIKKVIYS